jgi:hypothetical protein
MKRLHFQPSNPFTVQLDIDTSYDLILFHKHIAWLSCIMNENREPLRAFSETRSRSGKRWHVEIKLSVAKPLVWRIMLAAIMGSDRARELCNFERMMTHSKYPILFWKKASNSDGASGKTNRQLSTKRSIKKGNRN